MHSIATWWSDGTFWTAVASIAAIFFGLLGIWLPSVQRRLFCPCLRFEINNLEGHCSMIGGNLFLLVPVVNQSRWPAERVEVFLESMAEPHFDDPKSFVVPKFLPIRLTWTHSKDAPVCDQIAGEARRLLDFGAVKFPHGGGNTEFHFHSEITPKEQFQIPVGTVNLTLLVVCANGSPHRETFTMTIRKRDPEKQASLPDCMSLVQTI